MYFFGHFKGILEYNIMQWICLVSCISNIIMYFDQCKCSLRHYIKIYVIICVKESNKLKWFIFFSRLKWVWCDNMVEMLMLAESYMYVCVYGKETCSKNLQIFVSMFCFAYKIKKNKRNEKDRMIERKNLIFKSHTNIREDLCTKSAGSFQMFDFTYLQEIENISI